MSLRRSTKPAPTTQVRDLRETDLPEVAGLWLRAFRGATTLPPPSLLDYFREVFFRNPWKDDGPSSLVYRDRDGKVAGFLGVLPRRMVFEGRPIRVAVSTQLMVDPDKRCGVAAVELMRRFFAGPQDLSLTDGSNDPSSRLWEGLGGEAALLYSMEWTRVLRPARFAAGLLSKRKALRPALWAARPFGWAVDAAVARLPFGPSRVPAPSGVAEEATADSILRCWNGLPKKPALRPAYEPESFAWLLRMTASKKVHGELRKVLVRDAAGAALGWYLYYLQPGGVSRLVQLAAADGAAGLLLDHLFFDARSRGAAAVSGRMDPALPRELSDHHCRFVCHSRGVLIHSRDDALLQAVHRGDAFLSRLDGEWWMRFGSDSFD
jgi:hypothetical protein